jgi:molecular chaperone DnaK
MVKDAASHAEEDKKKREEIEVRNQADSLVYTTEKTLNEHRSKLSDSDARAVEDGIKELKSAMESGDVSRMKEKMEALTRASHRLAEIMYQQAQQQRQPSSGSEPGPQEKQEKSKEDEVVDAEFEDTNK